MLSRCFNSKMRWYPGCISLNHHSHLHFVSGSKRGFCSGDWLRTPIIAFEGGGDIVPGGGKTEIYFSERHTLTSSTVLCIKRADWLIQLSVWFEVKHKCFTPNVSKKTTMRTVSIFKVVPCNKLLIIKLQLLFKMVVITKGLHTHI